MNYLSLSFYILVIISIFLYYAVPTKARWCILLIASISFHYFIYAKALPIVIVTVAISYFISRLLVNKSQIVKSILLGIGVIAMLLPLVLTRSFSSLIVPVGISFYSLQIVAYLVDIYNAKIEPERNFFKYMLYVTYFPHIIQGPIPRYGQLSKSLFSENRFNEVSFTKGFQLILWGWFLKLLIADKAAIVSETIFGATEYYMGAYILVGIILYSIQLYADFQSCVCIAQGVSTLFGIEIADNFNHPYFSKSIKEFWSRWHISLGTWLRDYIYIPLGGNRKGKVRKWVNLVIVFLVSGVWHGTGLHYLVWGFMQAVYQIVGELTLPIRDKIYEKTGTVKYVKTRGVIQIFGTYILFLLSLVIFRIDSLKEGIAAIKSVFLCFKPWIFFDDSLFNLGLSWKEWIVLVVSVVILLCVSYIQEKGVLVREKILELPTLFRWLFYIGVIVTIVVFGTYGYGFNAQDFIYGGF